MASPNPVPERPPVVLLVEDEPLLRLDYADQLQARGFEVLEARDAQDALEILGGEGVSPDLVLSDIRMPGAMDGLGLAQWICANHCDIAVVLTSGSGRPGKLPDGVAFLEKPVDLDAVALRVSEAFGKRAR